MKAASRAAGLSTRRSLVSIEGTLRTTVSPASFRNSTSLRSVAAPSTAS